MPLTFGQVKSIVAEYAGRGGKCADSATVTRFAKEVLDYVRVQGTYGSVRKFCFIAQKGCFATPPEVDVPLKVRIDKRIGNIWSQWYSFHSVSADIDGCIPADKVLIEEPYYTATAFDLPSSGAAIGVLGTCSEAEDAFLIVKGKDLTGREIILNFGDEQRVGEQFKITTQLRTGHVTFGEITAVVKSRTNGYVQLWAIDPVSKQPIHFLSDYSPTEEIPQYRKFQVQSSKCGELTQITLLAKIKLKENYADNDVVPFDYSPVIMLAAQRLQAEAKNDIETAAHKRNALKDMVSDEHLFKKNAGTKFEVFHPLSGGAVRGIVRR